MGYFVHMRCKGEFFPNISSVAIHEAYFKRKGIMCNNVPPGDLVAASRQRRSVWNRLLRDPLPGHMDSDDGAGGNNVSKSIRASTTTLLKKCMEMRQSDDSDADDADFCSADVAADVDSSEEEEMSITTSLPDEMDMAETLKSTRVPKAKKVLTDEQRAAKRAADKLRKERAKAKRAAKVAEVAEVDEVAEVQGGELAATAVGAAADAMAVRCTYTGCAALAHNQCTLTPDSWFCKQHACEQCGIHTARDGNATCTVCAKPSLVLSGMLQHIAARPATVLKDVLPPVPAPWPPWTPLPFAFKAATSLPVPAAPLVPAVPAAPVAPVAPLVPWVPWIPAVAPTAPKAPAVAPAAVPAVSMDAIDTIFSLQERYDTLAGSEETLRREEALAVQPDPELRALDKAKAVQVAAGDALRGAHRDALRMKPEHRLFILQYLHKHIVDAECDATAPHSPDELVAAKDIATLEATMSPLEAEARIMTARERLVAAREAVQELTQRVRPRQEAMTLRLHRARVAHDDALAAFKMVCPEQWEAVLDKFRARAAVTSGKLVVVLQKLGAVPPQ